MPRARSSRVSKVRADVDRIIELYKRQGRFAATVEPKIVQLDQNRVDLVFEITEGDKSKVRAINIIGNDQFSDGRLQKEMYTKEAGGVFGLFKQNDSYDPDRLAADQQKLRAFYLTQGYADFRVVSALAELTPDRRDFVITYVVEEGPRYKFGTVEAASELRDFTSEQIKALVKIKPGDWFDAKKVEDTVTGLTEVAGIKGYAFAEISPRYNRDAEKRVMNITIEVGEAQRTYVERIDIQGNTVTRDKVIRREFRVNEGDAFNTIKVKRSQDRIQSLGFFQEKLEIKQTPGRPPTRSCSGSTSRRKRPANCSCRRAIRASSASCSRRRSRSTISWARARPRTPASTGRATRARRSSASPNPIFLDKAILLGGDIYRRDLNSFNNVGGERETTYSQTSTGGGLRLGFPVSEYLSFGTRYGLVADKITLNKNNFYTDFDGSGESDTDECDPAKAGTYLCDEIGRRLTSSLELFADLRQHQRHSRDARPAADAEPGFRGARRRRQIYPHPGRRDQIYPAARRASSSRRMPRAAISIRCRVRRARAAMRSASPTASSARRCAASIFAASARACAGPCFDGTDALADRRRRPNPTRWAAGPITWAGPSSNSRSARSCAASGCARRPSSTSGRCGA